MREHQGWIALDIDGTITDETHQVPTAVVAYLHSLFAQGWELVFITGRTYSFGTRALHVFDFPFYLAVQNGADILYMPEKRSISRCYLPAEMIHVLEKVYRGQPEDFIVYTGYERGDFCYYRPQRFSSQLLQHLEKIKALSPEPWQSVESFAFAAHEAFPLIKCLGFEEQMRAVHALLAPLSGIAVSLIRDPLEEGIFLNLVTAPSATKGSAWQRIIAHTGRRGKLIAAGDDWNDVSMLQNADVSIVMENAPLPMHREADIIAPRASRGGIIVALEQALR